MQHSTSSETHNSGYLQEFAKIQLANIVILQLDKIYDK
jgi:hypothetical protein